MLNQIFAVTIKDLKVLFRDRGGMVALFLMPIMFILVMSVAQKNMYTGVDEDEPLEFIVVNNDTGELADDAITELEAVEGLAIVSSIEGETLTRSMAEDLIIDGQYRVAVVFPEDFSDTVLAAAVDPETQAAVVTFIADPGTAMQFLAPIRGSLEGFIQKQAAYAQLPLQIQAGFDQIAAENPAEQASFVKVIGDAFISGMLEEGDAEGEGNLGVRFEQVAPEAYQVTRFPTSVEQNVPGYTIFGVFFIVQVLATSMLREKQDGTFRRLLVAPLPRPALLLGKLLPYYLINLVQITSMFAIGKFVFGMNLGSSPEAMIVVTLATAAAATGLGLLVATLGKTPEQIGGLSTMLALTLAAIGGMMVPTFAMPEFMQSISKISPHSWALSGFQDIIVRGLGLQDVLTEVGVLSGFALLFFIFAVWRFRFQE